uniref:Methyltransferase FkbM family n=1 Tax=Rhodopseudomonas palustris (strain DX-1) TaxID=652103 RepID=E6VGI4_RHOPX
MIRPLETTRFYLAAATPWKNSVRTTAAGSGLRFFTSTTDVVGRHLAKYGSHEAELTEWIGRFLSLAGDGIFVDVGANIGWHTVHAASRATRVVAFEPDAYNAWLLDLNVTENGLDNVIVQQAAVGGSDGLAKLHRYKNSNRGRHSLIANGGCSRTVPLVSLDTALQTLGLQGEPISLIKIDVEGFEPAVISGASATLGRTRAIVTEISPRLSAAGGLSVTEMAAQLAQIGFAPRRLVGQHLVDTSVTEIDGQLDVIWIRPHDIG